MGESERMERLPPWARDTLKTLALTKSLREGTVTTYINALLAWISCMGNLKPWEANEDEVRRAIACISEGRARNTANLYLARLKTLVRYIHGKTPPKWKQVKVRLRRGEIRDKLLTREEVRKLIDAAPSAKAKALVAMVYDGAFRISEAISPRIKDLTPFHHEGRVVGYVVSVKGKTGERSVLLIDSYPYLREWLLVHPYQTQICPSFPLPLTSTDLWVDEPQRTCLKLSGGEQD